MQKKNFNKIQHLVLTKIPSKLGIEGYFFNLLKKICKKLTAANILNAKRPKDFTRRMERETISCLILLLTQNLNGALSQCKKAKKRKKWVMIVREWIKVPLVIEKMIVYIENLKESAKKLLSKCELSYVMICKVNNQSSSVFLCTRND